MANIHSIDFTPETAGQVIVTATFEAEWNGSDFGAGSTQRAFCTQSGYTTYGDAIQLPQKRQSQIVRHVFSVTAGSPVTVGLQGDITGATIAHWWNVKITAELIKK